jgi:predicted amidohydrolase
VNVHLAQLAVERDLSVNLRRVMAVLETSAPADLVVFPEGMLSGYAPEDDGYAASLDAGAIERAIEQVQGRVAAIGCHCLLGSATRSEGAWRNSVLLFGGSAEPLRYHKKELSRLDRRHFAPGPTAGVLVRVNGVPVGVVACRELLFPDAWARLKQAGAALVCHVNNAVAPQDAQWTHLLIARAIEQSLFVCSVNNGAAPQALPSLLVAPSGRVVLQTDLQRDQVLTAPIDPGEAIADLSARTDY